MKKIISVVLFLAIVMAYAVPAMAAGNTFCCSGTSTSGYYTDNYFEIKNKATFYCAYASCTYPMKVCLAIYSGGWIQLTPYVILETGATLTLNSSQTVRRVYMDFVNTVSTTTYSTSCWQLDF